jgi:hypothetical protein
MSEYQVVPEHWFNDDQCWWPLDFTKKKTIHLITTYTVPDETTWQKYSAGSYGKIQLVKHSYLLDLGLESCKAAREHQKQAEAGHDIGDSTEHLLINTIVITFLRDVKPKTSSR